MAIAPVTLPPSLRAWAAAGMTHLLFARPVQISALRFPADQRLAPPPAQENVRPAATRAKPVANHARPRPEPSAPASASVPITSSASFAPRNDVPKDLTVWASPWGDILAKSAPAPILWTYHELGADLTGLGRSAERGDFFRKIIAELNLRKGSSVFWPSAISVADASGNISFHSEPGYFASGIDRLSPQLIVVFGKRALRDIGLDTQGPYFRQWMVEGKLLVSLPEISDHLQGSAQRASTLSLLRAVINTVRFF